MVDVNVHALARQDNLNVVPFPVMNSRWSLVLGKKIPEKNSARLGRVLQTARILRACAAWPDIEGFERVVVALPKGQAGSHCQGLYVKFDRAVTQSYAFRECHFLVVQSQRIYSLDLFEHTGFCLPVVGSHGDFSGLSGRN